MVADAKVAGNQGDGLNEVMTDIKNLQGEMANLTAERVAATPPPSERAKLAAVPAESRTVAPPISLDPAQGGVLSMAIQGNMAVQLSFGHQGEGIRLELGEQELTIHLFNGTVLKIPRLAR